MPIAPRSMRSRTIPLMSAALVLAAATTAAPAAAAPAAVAAGAALAAPSPTPTPDIPNSPVGEQLRWFLAAAAALPIPEDQIRAHFSAGFLTQVPPAQVNEALKSLVGLRLESLTQVTPTALSGVVTTARGRVQLSMSVDGDGRIDALLFGLEQREAPRSWAELDKRLRAIAPHVGFLAAEVRADGGCRPVHTVAPDTPRPLGSMFKLYVLGATAEQIKKGRLSWDTPLTIRPELKSLPSGTLQDRPDNSTVSVREAAKLMISISDNTGADLLIDKVGRARVEAQAGRWSGHAALNRPFLTTRELFLLKAVGYPRLARKYLSLDRSRRYRYLATTVARTPLTEVKAWNKPRDIDRLEWFASPGDVCRAFSGLSALNTPPLGEVMSANDAGLGLDAKAWPTVWFKGGSEPGVLSMGYLARDAAGRTYVVTALTGDPRTALDENSAGAELLALVRGSFAMLAKGRVRS
ncbi:serine hydrolase [Microbispora sp. KK1-11]|uniref:serine hydrolase n=1 Tax=Microbispora sp. KK1-11 TaxID=2053005 RepID=UPI0011588F0F|nr:serine hydrolase [Microbispora sp. KK1-11]TQS28778.1 serine hydrolase [Microbispora sp. KK1-11]